MKKKVKKLAGRPRTVNAGISFSLRINEETLHAMEKLAKLWNCSLNETVRRSVCDRAKAP